MAQQNYIWQSFSQQMNMQYDWSEEENKEKIVLPSIKQDQMKVVKTNILL